MGDRNSWVQYEDAELSTELSIQASEKIKELIEQSELTADEISYISKVQLRASKDVSHLSEEHLEKLRRMCSLWDVQLRPVSIRSHRPLIGPVIVIVKKMIFSMLSFLMKDFVRQQREFNGAAIAALIALTEPQDHKK